MGIDQSKNSLIVDCSNPQCDMRIDLENMNICYQCVQCDAYYCEYCTEAMNQSVKNAMDGWTSECDSFCSKHDTLNPPCSMHLHYCPLCTNNPDAVLFSNNSVIQYAMDKYNISKSQLITEMSDKLKNNQNSDFDKPIYIDANIRYQNISH